MSIFSHYTLQIGLIEFNLDTIIVSFAIAMLLIGLALHGASKRWDQCEPVQNLCEYIVEMMDEHVYAITGTQHNVALISVALTTFFWTLGMNCMELIPHSIGDVISSIFGLEEYFNLVPTEDINVALCLAGVTVATNLYYAVFNSGGIEGYAYSLLSKPLGIYAFPLNLAFNILKLVIKFCTLALRLFGNMFVGKIIIDVIRMFSPPAIFACTLIWTALHCIVLVVQPFILMELLLLYIGPIKNFNSP